MGKQIFDTLDYFGPLFVGAIFFITLFLLSFFLINYCFITKNDDVTKFELFGAKRNIRLGPHTLHNVKMAEFHKTTNWIDEDEE